MLEVSYHRYYLVKLKIAWYSNLHCDVVCALAVILTYVEHTDGSSEGVYNIHDFIDDGRLQCCNDSDTCLEVAAAWR